MSLRPGSRFGGYEVVALLGAGGMGEVYRGRDTALNRDVALKVLPEIFALDGDRLARFTREAQTLAALNHANIAAIYGFEQVSGVRALVMELIEGEDLSQRLERGPVPLSEALAIARQIAEALEAAHEQGIVHRDLKPANVKLRSDGVVKVLDFGLAKAVTPESSPGSAEAMHSPTMTVRATALGLVIGTAAYMAPEQARGKAVDRRADIWAFGVVLYEMLTGRRPFQGDDISITLANVLKDDVSWDPLPASVPAPVRRLLRRCLEKDPRHRLSSIGDARLDLDDAGEKPDATATSPRPRWRTWAWPAAAIALVGLTAVATAQWRRPAAMAHVRRLAIVPPDATELFPDSRQVAISPDGRFVAFVTGTIANLSASQLWVRPLDAPAARLVEGANGASMPFWSADSRHIGFFAEGKLKTVPAEGGRIDVVCNALDGRGGTWNADGVIVFAPSNAGPLLKVAAGGGDPSPATTLDAGRKQTGHRFPFFLPDGQHFLFVALPAVNGLYDVFAGSIDAPGVTKLLSAQSAAVYTDPGYLLFSRRNVVTVQPFDAQRLKLTGEAVMLDDVPGFVGNVVSGGSAVSASPDALIYGRDPFSSTTLLWTDRDGRQTGVVEAPEGRYSQIRLSPDGQHAAVVRLATSADSSLWVVDLARHGATRIADAPHLNYEVAWSPDGKRLAYTNDGSGIENIFVRDAAAAMPAALLYSSLDLFKKPQSWSPDGRTLLYGTKLPESGNDVLALDASGARTSVPYAHEPFNEDQARFSPDGRWVAYVSDEAGANDIYVRSFPVPDKKYRVTVDGGTWVWWNHDGTALLIVGADARHLKLARVRPGADFAIDPPEAAGVLPEGALAVDAAADLQHLLVAVPKAGAARPSLTVVSDWQSLVKR